MGFSRVEQWIMFWGGTVVLGIVTVLLIFLLTDG
jgi:hypothetical protein